MEWPTQSPDLNPIENLCQMLRKQYRVQIQQVRKNDGQSYKICRIEIEKDRCQNLVGSMTRRCANYQRANNQGYKTKY